MLVFVFSSSCCCVKGSWFPTIPGPYPSAHVPNMFDIAWGTLHFVAPALVTVQYSQGGANGSHAGTVPQTSIPTRQDPTANDCHAGSGHLFMFSVFFAQSGHSPARNANVAPCQRSMDAQSPRTTPTSSPLKAMRPAGQRHRRRRLRLANPNGRPTHHPRPTNHPTFRHHRPRPAHRRLPSTWT